MPSQIDPLLDDRQHDNFRDLVGNESGESLFKTLWRHKLLFLICTSIAAGVGFWHHGRKPLTYAASTNLMIRSENPLVLDVDSGAYVGGIPDAQVISSLIRSDNIILDASNDLEIAALSSVPGSVANKLRSGLVYKSHSAGGKSDRAISTLSFEGTDPDFCVAAVNAAARAIEAYFEKERATSLNTFSALIRKAEDKLFPELEEWEAKYQEFRRTAPLDWANNGEAVNPHRERLPRLREQLFSLENERRQLRMDFDLIKSVWEKEKDLTLVTHLIKQISGNSMSVLHAPLENFETEEVEIAKTPIQKPEFEMRRMPDVQVQDLELQFIQVEESLLSLEVQLDSTVAELGNNHPSVRTIRQQVESTREKMQQLAEKRKIRMDELEAEFEAKRKEWLEKQASTTDPLVDLQGMLEKKRSKAQIKFISGYSASLKQRIQLIDEQHMEIQDTIAREKASGDALVQAETDDAMYRRQIETVRGMLIQLEEQMTGLNISEVNNGIRVEPLMSSVSPYVTGPNLGKDMLVSILVGLGISGLLSLLLEANARTFRNSEQIASELQVSLLAHIPLDDASGNRKRSEATGDLKEMHANLSVIHRPECSASEAFRCARTNILFDSTNNGRKVYQVTSPLPGDGKSTIAANLACTLAQSNKRTLLIDLDLRSPRLTARFDLAGEPGVTNLLNGEVDPIAAIRSTAIEGLDVLPSGTIPSNPAEALLLPEMEDAFAWFRDQYDFVIVDCPPLLLVTDPAITTQYVDATILALRIVRKSRPNANEAVAILRNAGAEIAGVVINKIDEVNVGSYYQIGGDGSYRSVGYGYGKKYRKERTKAGEANYVVLGKSQGLKQAELRTPEVQPLVGSIESLDDGIEIDFDSGVIDNG